MVDTRIAPDFDRFQPAIELMKKFLIDARDSVDLVLAQNDLKLSDFNRARLQNIKTQIAQELQSRMDTGGGVIRSLIRAAYSDGLKILPPTSSPAEFARWNQIHIAKVETLANEMTRNVSDSLAQVGRWVDDELRRVQIIAAEQAQLTGLSRAQQSQRLSDLMDRGRLSMPRGFKGDIAAYTDMVATTNLAESNRQAREARSLERGINLMWIVGHDATDTCGDFEETIFSSVANDRGIPTRADLRTNSSHIFGVNCKHVRIVPVTPRLFSASQIERAIGKGIAAQKRFS